ncbi:hypothetical protein FB451DRAFT_1189816 [Mycena latifolia]|nr:hypothetical protein FB451DRAFT_1189816 [Mycena latifolia]
MLHRSAPEERQCRELSKFRNGSQTSVAISGKSCTPLCILLSALISGRESVNGNSFLDGQGYRKRMRSSSIAVLRAPSQTATKSLPTCRFIRVAGEGTPASSAPHCPLCILRNYSSSGESVAMTLPAEHTSHPPCTPKPSQTRCVNNSHPPRTEDEYASPRTSTPSTADPALPCAHPKKSCYSSTFDTSGRVSLHTTSLSSAPILRDIISGLLHGMYLTATRHAELPPGAPPLTKKTPPAVTRASTSAARHPRCLPNTLHTRTLMHTCRASDSPSRTTREGGGAKDAMRGAEGRATFREGDGTCLTMRKKQSEAAVYRSREYKYPRHAEQDERTKYSPEESDIH